MTGPLPQRADSEGNSSGGSVSGARLRIIDSIRGTAVFNETRESAPCSNGEIYN